MRAEGFAHRERPVCGRVSRRTIREKGPRHREPDRPTHAFQSVTSTACRMSPDEPAEAPLGRGVGDQYSAPTSPPQPDNWGRPRFQLHDRPTSTEAEPRSPAVLAGIPDRLDDVPAARSGVRRGGPSPVCSTGLNRTGSRGSIHLDSFVLAAAPKPRSALTQPFNTRFALIEQRGDAFFLGDAADRLADQGRDRDDADVARDRTASVGWIVSVITSSLSLEAAMRATAPPESTPWVI